MMGAWQAAPIVAIIAVLGIIVTAAYILLVVRRVFFGDIDPEYAGIVDISLQDKIAIGLLVAIMIILGCFPALMSPLIQSGVNHVLVLLGGK
jgi:NADH-quinone oxidoreductase subunit M